MVNIYEARSANKTRTAIIAVLFFLFFAVSIYFLTSAFSVFFGYQVGGIGYVGVALIISGITSFVSYWYSDKIILGLSKASPADRKRDFEYYTVVENLSIAADIPTPKLYVIEDSAPNAFATGRNPENSAVCVTSGLMQKLNRSELEGVIAHELSHIKSYDILLMSVVSVMVGTIALLGDWLLRTRIYHSRGDSDRGNLGSILIILGILFAILSPIVANLIKLALSRRREFSADAASVAITRQPSGLISALQKISGDREALEVANKATAHLYISDPFEGKNDKRALSKLAGLFNTHPPLGERISALKSMS